MSDGPATDWDAEQQRLLDEKFTAHEQRLRLQPRGPASAEETARYKDAAVRAEVAERRWAEFCQRRLREDSAWNNPVR